MSVVNRPFTARSRINENGGTIPEGMVPPFGRRFGPSTQLNESPQAQELPAFGLSMVKPWASIRSAKSIVAPVR